MMKALYSLLFLQLLFLNNLIVKGQNIIMGQIINSNNSEPVSYASISMQKGLTSYIANEKGEFKINILEKCDSLFINSMGYETGIFVVANVQRQKFPVLIKLLPKDIILEEIFIYPPKVIVQKAIEHVPMNYNQDFFSIEGLYREKVKLDNKYVGFAESTFSYFDWGYNKEIYKTRLSRFNVNPFLFKQSRRSNYNISLNNRGFDRNFLHFDNFYFENKFIRDGFFSGDNIDFQEYKFEEESYYDGQDVYVISFKPNSKMLNKISKKEKYNHLLALGSVYISKNDFAIVKFSITMSNNWYMNFKTDEFSKITFFKADVNYTKLDNKYFVDYSRLESKYEEIPTKREVHEISEIFINQRDLQPLQAAEYKRYENIFNWNYFAAEPYRWVMNKYNAEFWKNYISVPIEDFEKIRNDLEMDQSLETQFRHNSEKPLYEGGPK